jgi:TolB protein
LAEDRVEQVLTRVEQSFSPDEAFGEKLYATLAVKLDTETILSRVEQSISPDEEFSEKLFVTLSSQLEGKNDTRRRGAFFGAAIGQVAQHARRLGAFRLQAAGAILVAALGILALIVNATQVPQQSSPLAGPPIGEVGDPASPTGPPSIPPAGCVCPTPASGSPTRARGGVSATLEKGQLPSSSASHQIAFSRVSDSADARFQIFTMNLDGTNLRRVTPGDTHDYRQPSWSPDRKRLVFTRTAARTLNAMPQGRGGEIFVANTDGSNMQRIAEGGSPEWSPDGSLIVYHYSRGGGPGSDGPAIWTMKPDGTSRRYLTHDSTDPTWSPDGQYIAFGSIRTSEIINVPDGVVNEYKMRSDGSDVVQLTGNPTLTCFADWSPNGRLIAYTSQVGVFTRLMLMNPDGTGQRQITHDDVSNVAPSWSPDGSLIAFEHAPRGDSFYIARPADPNGDPASIWVMKPDGSLRKRVSPLDGWNYFDPSFAP